jgi:hypothetical protein
MNRILLWIALLGNLVILAGCSSPLAYISNGSAEDASMTRNEASAIEAGPSAQTKIPDSLATGKSERDYVKIGTVCLDIPLLEPARVQLRELTQSLGGYVEVMQTKKFILRIPSAQFEATINKLKAIGEITSQDLRVVDVTDSVRDINVKLKNLIALRTRLEALMQKSETVKETLEIERELNRVQTEIEHITSRQKTLTKQVRYAQLTVNLSQRQKDNRHRNLLTPPWLIHLGLQELMS